MNSRWPWRGPCGEQGNRIVVRRTGDSPGWHGGVGAVYGRFAGRHVLAIGGLEADCRRNGLAVCICPEETAPYSTDAIG
jgi:hypothetical protein